jgi:2-polyprenyl-3-methyl-5-hydroxy-6-metoxy-1,4-benzoquinol methylase
LSDTRYSYDVDLEHPTTSQSQAVLLVTPGSTVLDVGAADGSVARPLAARGCRVWAIELDASAAANARRACERVIVGDVEQLDLDAALDGQQFDFILLLDVLEHLRDPLASLERVRDCLVPGGRVIASIPNITHGAVRLSLMSGAFTYTETGLLDRTHLRFFDRRGAENLFADARLRIVERLRVRRALTETEIPIDLSQFAPSVIQKLNEDPEATTYQFLLVGKPLGGEHIPEGVSLAERLQRNAETLEAQYRELEQYARSLEQRNRDEVEELNRDVAHGQTAEETLRKLRGDLDALGIDSANLADAIQQERAQSAEVRSEVERCLSELAQHHLELRHLRADLAVKDAFIAEMRQAEIVKEAALTEMRRAEIVKEAALTEMRRAEIVKEAALIDLQRQLFVAQGDLARTQEALERLRVFTNAAGFRILSDVTRSLNKYPGTYKILQSVVRRMAGKPPETLTRFSDCPTANYDQIKR